MLRHSQSCTVLPSLPGYNKKTPANPKLVKAFEVVNGVRIDKTTLVKTELRDGIPHSIKFGQVDNVNHLPTGIKFPVNYEEKTRQILEETDNEILPFILLKERESTLLESESFGIKSSMDNVNYEKNYIQNHINGK